MFLYFKCTIIHAKCHSNLYSNFTFLDANFIYQSLENIKILNSILLCLSITLLICKICYLLGIKI